MNEQKLETIVSKNISLKAEDIRNMSNEQLDSLIVGNHLKTTSEQLTDAKVRVKNAKEEAEKEYLKSKKAFFGWINSFLYKLNIYSPEKELEKKNNSLISIKANLDRSIEKATENIKKGYEETINSEKRKLAIEIRIGRIEKALQEEEKEYLKTKQKLLDEKLDETAQSMLEWDLEESRLNSFDFKNDLKRLKPEYVLTHKKNTVLKSALASQELDLQRIRQTKYDLECQMDEINILLNTGVTPETAMGFMEQSYFLIEESESLKSSILKNSYHISEAISGVKIVTSKQAKENYDIYQKNASLATKINDGFELEYEQIKENSKR